VPAAKADCNAVMQREAAPIVRRQGAATRGACVSPARKWPQWWLPGGHDKQNVRFCLIEESPRWAML